MLGSRHCKCLAFDESGRVCAVRRRCLEHGLADPVSSPHEKADICAVWDALCYGLPPPLSLSPGKSSTKSESFAYLQLCALATLRP